MRYSTFRLGSNTGRTTRGLLQGSKVSCELFILFLGEMLKSFKNKLQLNRNENDCLITKIPSDT